MRGTRLCCGCREAETATPQLRNKKETRSLPLPLSKERGVKGLGYGVYISCKQKAYIPLFIQVNTKLRSILFGIYNNEAVRYRLRQNDEKQLKEFIILHVAKEIKTLKTT